MKPVTKTDDKKPEEKKPEDKNNAVAKVQPTHSERFTQMVSREFESTAGGLQLTSFQRKLCQNYFIKIDQMLKDTEKKRLAKDEKYRDPVALEWKNVNMQKLAVDVVSFSAVGLDPAQPNHINMIPFKNSSTAKYDIGFIPGYRGIEIKARKYGLDIPDDVVVELVYSKDKFKQIKKDVNNRIESYLFEVVEDFNRGELVGGFYYHVFNSHPEKNKIRVFTKDDIDKRKPDTASVEFWGGDKDKWEYDPELKKRVKKGTETVEGWYDEMAYKTIYRAAYNSLTIDSAKIDEHFHAMMEREREVRDARVDTEIRMNANQGEPIGFENETVTEAVVVDQLAATADEAAKPADQNDKQNNGPTF